MRPIKLITDSTSDLSVELAQKRDIAIVPLYVNFGLQSGKDNVDITTKELFDKVKETGQLPKTSAPTIADYATEFKKYIDEGKDVLYISLSSKISTSYQNACATALQFPEGRVKIIDSLNLSSGVGILVMTAADCIERGLSLDATISEVQSLIPRVKTRFLLDTVEYLHKGGRCSGLQMLLSSLLEIHPIIEVTDGTMHLAEKVRGNRQVVLRSLVKDALDNMDSMRQDRIFVTHCECPEDASWVQTQLAEPHRIKQILLMNANCVISSHCGPKTRGIIYIEK